MIEYERITVKNLDGSITVYGGENPLQRLADLEDKIEQGEFITLPEKTGKAVWYIEKQDGSEIIKPMTIKGYTYTEYGLYAFDCFDNCASEIFTSYEAARKAVLKRRAENDEE